MSDSEIRSCSVAKAKGRLKYVYGNKLVGLFEMVRSLGYLTAPSGYDEMRSRLRGLPRSEESAYRPF